MKPRPVFEAAAIRRCGTCGAEVPDEDDEASTWQGLRYCRDCSRMLVQQCVIPYVDRYGSPKITGGSYRVPEIAAVNPQRLKQYDLIEKTEAIEDHVDGSTSDAIDEL